MSTSSVITKSGAVALDSAIRRATVRCRRESSTCSTSPRPASRRLGRSASALLRRARLARLAALGCGLDVGLDDPPAGAGALDRRDRSRPLSLAIRRAIGEALTRSPRPRRAPASGSGAPRPLRARSSSVLVSSGSSSSSSDSSSASSSSSSASSSSSSARSSSLLVLVVFLVGLLGLLFALVLVLVLVRAPPPPSPIRAIVSPTGSVSPSLATISSVPDSSAS